MRRLLAPVLAALILAPAGFAATFTFTVFTASPVTAATVTLNGDDQSQTVTVVGEVAYTGTGNTAGWHMTASATVPTSGSRTLPALVVSAGGFQCVTGCTTNPTNGIAYPLTLSTTAQKVYNAAANTGRGTFYIGNSYVISYPANAIPGTYTSTVTLAGATSP
jgi:hypothetical protein